MKKLLLVALLTASWTALAAEAIPTFNVFADDFERRLNAVIQADDDTHKNDGGLETCTLDRRGVAQCVFRKGSFNRLVESLKKINLINGRFTQKTRLSYTVVNQRVAEVSVVGDRSDPPNFLTFASTVANVAAVFDPGIERSEGFNARLGLLRGDSAPDIGRARSVINPNAEIVCLASHSSDTTEVRCKFVPRF